MKLRSGKTLSTLPSKLNNELETKLQEFKKTFAENPKHAKELLNIISEAWNGGVRFEIRDKIEEVYNNNEIPGGTGDLMGAAGELAWVLVFNPNYHDIISERIQTFDLEMPLLGNMEE